MQAKAAVAVQPNRVEFCDVTVPEMTAEEVVIRLTHSWISNGTESSFVRGERIAGDTPLRDTDPAPFPMVPGYQKCGVIERVGAGVKNLEVGDRVFATMSRVEGMFFDSGGHVSPAVTHFSQVWKLPDNVSSEAASGLVLLQVGFNCGMRPPVSRGDCAVVIGDGMVGHWAAQTLQERGARVLLAGRHNERLQLFSRRDGDEIVNTKARVLADAARDWAPQNVAVVVDTVGDLAAVESLYETMRHESHIVSAGFYGDNGKIDIQPLRALEATLHTPAGWNQERMDETLAWLARGALKTEHLITHRFAAEAAGDAFDLILSRRDGVLGVILEWK